MQLKKFLCTALSISAFAASFNALAAIPSDVAGTRYEEPVQVLNALKIMIGDDNGTFRLDDTIIRSEVAKMAVHAMGMEELAESSKGSDTFYDVPADHWANGYIHVASTLGLIVGDGDGNFRPDDKITYAEAMAIFVRATGYESSAQSKGGFPRGYISTGTSIGLSDNVQGTANEYISRGNVAFLAENSLEANLMEQTGFGSNIKYEVTDKTLLEHKLKVTKIEGQVTACEGVSIDGSSSLGKNQIKIDGKLYNASESFVNLLGHKVVCYIQENSSGRNELILALSDKGLNSTLEVTAELFNKVTTRNGNHAIEYFKNESSSSTATAEIESDAVMIYNGKKIDFDANELDFSNKEGAITLLDTSGNSKYDIVFINEYRNYVVDQVISSNKIVDKYNNGTLKLDDTVNFTIKKGSAEIAIKDLREFDVLSVYESKDKTHYAIDVSSNYVEGKIRATNSKGVYIGDNHYKVAKNYTNPLDVNTEGVFYLDVSGKIAAVDASNALSSDYAYLLNAYTDNGSGVSTFKLYTKTGTERVFNTDAKIQFNDSYAYARDIVTAFKENGVVNKQLVTFTTNSEGKLTGIKTAQDNSANGAVDTNKFTLNYKLTDAVYDADLSKLDNVRVDDNTLIFNIPDNSDDYEITNKSVFEDGQKYNAQIFDMSESYTAKVIVLTSSNLNANASSSLAVVKSISSATNSSGDRVQVLDAIVDGSEKSIYAKDNSILVKGESKALEAGDLIQYKTNSKDEIVSIRVLLDISAKDTEAVSEPIENLKTVYGKVTKKFSDSINVTVNDGAAANYPIGNDVKIYSVETGSSRNIVTNASMADIEVFDSEEGNRVFLKLYKGVVSEVVIIK